MRAAIVAIVVVLSRVAAASPDNIRTLKQQAERTLGKAQTFEGGSLAAAKVLQVRHRPESKYPCTLIINHAAPGGKSVDETIEWTSSDDVELAETSPKRLALVHGNSQQHAFVFRDAGDAQAARDASRAMIKFCARMNQAREFLKTNIDNNLTTFNVSLEGKLHGEGVKSSRTYFTDCTLDLSDAPHFDDASKAATINFSRVIEVRPLAKNSDTDSQLFIAGPCRIKDGGNDATGSGLMLDPHARSMMERMIDAAEFLRTACNPAEPGGF